MSTRSDLDKAADAVSQRLVFLMTCCCAFAVSAIYYHQPLLPQMASTFGVSLAASSWIATVTQLGYAAGLLFFVPLGDRIQPRTLAATAILVNTLALLGCALAPSFSLLAACSALVGLTAISAQIIIPTISGRADEASRGRVVGTLLGGLSAGLLLARTVSGYAGAHLGWRTMFVLAAALDVVLLATVWRSLPLVAARPAVGYLALLRSMATLVKEEPVLRIASACGFLMFAAFSALWATLAAMLSQAPYGFGPASIGAFGLVGLAGMLASGRIGALVDRVGERTMVLCGAGLVGLAFVLIAFSGHGLAWLVAGMVLLDFGNRAGLVANQSRVFALRPQARSRLNTVFMVSYFLGGAAGAALGGVGAHRAGWQGMALVGLGLAAMAGLLNALSPPRPHVSASPPLHL